MAGPTEDEGKKTMLSSINQLFAITARMKTDPQTLCDLFGQYAQDAALGNAMAPDYGVLLYGDADKYGDFTVRDWGFISAACAKCADGSLYILGEPRKGGMASIIAKGRVGTNILGYDETDFLDLAAKYPAEKDAAEEAFLTDVHLDGWRMERIYGVKLLGFHSSDDDVYPSARSFAKTLSFRVPIVELYDRRSLDMLYSMGDEACRYPEK